MFKQIAIIGTTASGKTELALKLAQNLDAIILSLDSLCVYKQINIASAKPSQEEIQKTKHFGINLINVNENFDVMKFIDEYNKAKNYAQNAGKILIITGGSGFYLKTLLSGLAPKIQSLPKTKTNSEIWELVSKIDTEFAEKFSSHDTYRLQKWFEIYSQTGQIPSLWLKNNTQEAVIKDITIFEIVWQRQEIIDRIKLRTTKMFENGLLKEARFLFENFNNDLKALNCVGLKECRAYLNNEFGKQNELKESVHEAIFEKNSALFKLHEAICIHTNQLAKRQRTFNKSAFPNRTEVIFNQAFELIMKHL